MQDDSFWDISVQKTEVSPTCRPTRTPVVNVKTAEVTLPSRNAEDAYSDSTITRFVSNTQKKPNTDRKAIFKYTPKNPLIKGIQVFTDNDCDSVFARDNLFMRERRALIDREGIEVPHVPFYSMMPRYSQMTKPQLRYYLWWRQNVRRGVWLECDISYVLLYAHELIACEDGDKDAVLCDLCRLYKIQSGQRRMADYGIGNLICDFCILYDLKLPEDILGDKMSEFVAYSALPEFFIDISDRYDPELHKKLIYATSLYNYKKSKHYIGNEEIFEKHVAGVLKSIFENDTSYAAISAFSSMAYGDVLSSRKPFFRISGLTTKHAKIKISYYPLSFLQAPVTDAIRYTENKIREHLGIKSRLNVTTLNPDIRAVIDEYAAKNCPPMTRERQRAIIEEKSSHEYDRFYDVPKTALSLDNAKSIEAESWRTTQILIETFSEEGSDEHEAIPVRDTVAPVTSSLPVTPEAHENDCSDGSVWDRFSNILGGNVEFLRLCVDRRYGEQRSFASAHSTTADELCELVNSAALDIIGDILLCDDGDGYALIEDYENLF